MKYWIWVSCQCDGCRVCSLRTNKPNRVTTTEQDLTLFKRNPKEFLRRFETWIHWYTSETKEQSKQWTLPAEQTVPSAGKVMATVFWDSQGIIYMDYLEKGKRITGLYYAELLGRLDAELKKKMAPFGKKKSALPSWQRTGSHLRRRHGQIGRITLRTAAPFTLFTRFGPLQLLFVS